jgi:tetratricopeptide (TPR) repeat protein
MFKKLLRPHKFLTAVSLSYEIQSPLLYLPRRGGDIRGGFAIVDPSSSTLGRGSAALGLLLLAILAFSFPVTRALAQSDSSEKLPMYGQPGIPRPESLKKLDEDFIRDATLRFGNRQAASRALAEQGWASIRRGMFDVAMRRFNEAWLLNPKNYQAFWGFGAVLSEQGKLADAIAQLETARELIDDPKQRPALLSDLGAVHSAYGARLPADKQLDRAQHFVTANNRFAESLEMDPNYSRSWREWAFSLYEQERYSEAWVKAKRAMELNSEPFPAGFLDSLKKKVPEAK